jgi:hypothetical protein
VLEGLASGDDIARETDRLLKRAGAYDRFPTPVDDIVQAAGLAEAPDFVLDESAIARVPRQFRAALRRASAKLQGALDRRERVVHVSDLVTNEGKRNFVKLHEVTHAVLPHQQQMLYADNHETLSPTVKAIFEQEANQGAAELLFQRDRFTDDARGLEVGVAAVAHLAARYGASLHATFRRYAETHRLPVMVIRLSAEESSDGSYNRYEQPCSAAWVSHFGQPAYPRQLTPARHDFLAAIEHSLDEVQIRDLTGCNEVVSVEALQTPYATFLILWVPGRRAVVPRRRVRFA